MAMYLRELFHKCSAWVFFAPPSLRKNKLRLKDKEFEVKKHLEPNFVPLRKGNRHAVARGFN
ncbi:MAG: hypothetical protein HQK85_05405 [Nitrospinae bacterium]|nr:hypothetical protein [Nitrospinota bacterium]